MHNRTIAAIAASSLLAAFAAQAQKGAAYSAPAQEPEYARFTITGGATYLKPDLNGLDYFNVTTFDSPTGQNNIYSVDPGYQWGYYLAAGYMISTHYDAQASWTQLNTNNSDTASAGLDTSFTTSNQFGFFDTGVTTTAYSTESLNYEAFDATLGQYHKLGENLMSRLFAGVRYAKITNNTLNDYNLGDIDYYTDFIFDSYDSQFSGWGPEVGVDVNYVVYDWFGIVGHFAAAFLVGELEASSNTFYSDSYSGQVAVQDNQEGRMIPALDAKLGLTFGVPFMEYDDRFMIEAGYQVAYYFNVVDQIQTQANNDFSDAGNFSIHNYSDVGIMGPYANLSVKF